MSKAFDDLLDALDWQPKPKPKETGGLPWVTHEGILTITGMKPLRVSRLNDGRRIIDANDLAAWFGSETTEQENP